jgi:hypothetical protein
VKIANWRPWFFSARVFHIKMVFDLVFALFANKWYQSLVRDSIKKIRVSTLFVAPPPPNPSRPPCCVAASLAEAKSTESFSVPWSKLSPILKPARGSRGVRCRDLHQQILHRQVSSRL